MHIMHDVHRVCFLGMSSLHAASMYVDIKLCCEHVQCHWYVYLHVGAVNEYADIYVQVRIVSIVA